MIDYFLYCALQMSELKPPSENKPVVGLSELIKRRHEDRMRRFKEWLDKQGVKNESKR